MVGLLNSLRLLGHDEPVTVLERGMSKEQKDAIRDHCRIVSLTANVRNPCHLTAYPAQFDAAGICVLIDADALVVGRLDTLIEQARTGKICLSPDPDDSRYFEEWQEIFALEGPPRRQTYYNTGLVIFSTEAWPNLLDRWWDALQRIWHRPSYMEGAPMMEDPTSQPDQDALNAILMSEVGPGAIYEIPESENLFPADLPAVELRDVATLSCAFKGKRVNVIQCSGRPKPWAWEMVRLQRSTHCYLPLLRRVLVAEDVAVEIPRSTVPPWLWRGPLGEAAFRVLRLSDDLPGIRSTVRRILGW